MASRWAGWMTAVAVACLAAATCGDGSPNGPGAICSYTLTPPARTIGFEGGSATVTVTAVDGCAWTASSGVPWISVTSGAAGSGAGSVVYAAAPNGSPDSRSGVVTIASQPHTVTQLGRPAPACTYVIDPEGANFTKDAASGRIAISAPAGCAWAAESRAPWLLLTSAASGSGDGTLTYAVARNDEAAERSATISIADHVFEVRQQGDVGTCEYAVTPVEFSPCMPATTLRVLLSTQAACPWTATPGVGWLGVSVSSGAGPATLDVTVSENYDAPRDGTVEIRWPTVTAGQNVRVAQAGCLYALSREAITFPAAGGASTVDVLQQSLPIACGGPLQDRCVWTAVSDVPWITITSSMPRTGDNPVAFTVAANSGPARTGRITVRDEVVLITQAGT